MPKVMCALLIGAALAGSAGTIGAAPSSEPATATAAPNRAGARPAALTLTFQTELQCGRLRGGTILVRLPSQQRVPRTIPATAILVSGVPAAHVGIAGHSLGIDPPRPTGIVCNVITMGSVKIVVTRAANLGNPRAPGTYPVSIRGPAGPIDAKLTIR